VKLHLVALLVSTYNLKKHYSLLLFFFCWRTMKIVNQFCRCWENFSRCFSKRRRSSEFCSAVFFGASEAYIIRSSFEFFSWLTAATSFAFLGKARHRPGPGEIQPTRRTRRGGGRGNGNFFSRIFHLLCLDQQLRWCHVIRYYFRPSVWRCFRLLKWVLFWYLGI
jgi:hypothetical protein